MKKILVPTDFSDNARRALEYAVAIANRFNSHILLFHAYRVGTSAAETFKTTVDEIVRQDSEAELQKLLAEFRPQLSTGSIEGQVARGTTSDLIIAKANTGDFDLIIMGTRGSGGLKGLLLGSTAMAVVRHADTPVIAIPEHAKVHPIHQIVMAVDGYGVADPGQLQPLVEMARSYAAEVCVFHKKEKEEEEKAIHPSVATGLDGVKYRYCSEESPIDDISDSIKAFVESRHADLLCLIRRKKSFIDRLLEENVTRDALSDSPIPILVMKG